MARHISQRPTLPNDPPPIADSHQILSIDSIVSAMKTELGRRPSRNLAPGHERVNMRKSTRDPCLTWSQESWPRSMNGCPKGRGSQCTPLEFPSEQFAL